VRVAPLLLRLPSLSPESIAILGAGVSPDTPSWGNMIAIGRGYLERAPFIVFEPALMIFFTVLALNMLGDVVRARFDVREGAL